MYRIINMLKINVFIIFALSGCSSFEVYNPDKYNTSSIYYKKEYANLMFNFVICGGVFANNKEIDYKANEICSHEKKVALYMGRNIFSTCYLLKPMGNIYQCV